jgi:hypothetical protein
MEPAHSDRDQGPVGDSDGAGLHPHILNPQYPQCKHQRVWNVRQHGLENIRTRPYRRHRSMVPDMAVSRTGAEEDASLPADVAGIDT